MFPKNGNVRRCGSCGRELPSGWRFRHCGACYIDFYPDFPKRPKRARARAYGAPYRRKRRRVEEALGRNGGCTVRSLGKLLMMSYGEVKRILSDLVASGAARSVRGEDGRVRYFWRGG